jgi:hypothetical protein
VLKAEIRFPFRDEAIAEVDCSAYATFSRAIPFDDELKGRFVERDGIIILWPHLRAYVAQVGQMMGLPFPPLPLLNAKIEAAILPEEAETTAAGELSGSASSPG